MKATAGSGPDRKDAAVARKRTRSMLAVTLVLLLVAAGQLFNIQVVKGAELAEQGRLVRTSASAVQAPRGLIVDSSGQVLADSNMTYHIAVNQNNILEYRHIGEKNEVLGQGPAEAAELLAPLLNQDPAELGGKMLGDSTYEYLAKNVDEDTYRTIRRLNIYGIEWEPVYERVYPMGETASDIVGLVNGEGVGSAGLEQEWNETLTGSPGEESYEIGPTGEIIPGAKVLSVEAKPGSTVHTTLMLDLQHSVQASLDQAVADYGADWGAVVVRRVDTPEVLVMAGAGIEESEGIRQGARAVQLVYEPGSTAKMITMAAALQAGVVGPETSFYMEDEITVANGQVFVDIYDHPRIERTVTGIFAQSLNTGTVMIGELVSDQERYDLMKKFGLGDSTSVGLPGESQGLLTSPETWDGRTRYTTMFGQGMALTALQAATMAATVGNGGVRIDPRIIAGVTDSEGVFTPVDNPAPVEVLRPEVSQVLLSMMESVTSVEDSGTASYDRVEGYRIGAKTGTAEIAGGGTIANLVAVIPADEPQVAVSVVLYNPQTGHTSAESAVPLFKQVALDTIRVLDIAPSEESPRLYLSSLTEQV